MTDKYDEESLNDPVFLANLPGKEIYGIPVGHLVNAIESAAEQIASLRCAAQKAEKERDELKLWQDLRVRAEARVIDEMRTKFKSEAAKAAEDLLKKAGARAEKAEKSFSESRAGEARLREAAQRMVDEWNIVASTVSESGRGTPCGATKDFLDALSFTEPAEKFLNEERAKVWEEAAKCMDNQPGPVGPVSMAIWFRDRATACRNNLESKSGSAKGE